VFFSDALAKRAGGAAGLAFEEASEIRGVFHREAVADLRDRQLRVGEEKRGSIVGATDELGVRAVDVVHPIRDLHVTLLHLLGLDDNKLTYYHAGRYKQLSQFGGQVIKELIA
jgi:hypothetical protein